MKLSLCMIAKGELENLQRLHPIVKNHIDDWVVVVPPGDSAIEFLKSVKANVIVHDFTQAIEPKYLRQFKEYGLEVDPDYRLFNFEAARNESFKQAVGDYILWLDGDDAPVGLDRLRKYVEDRQHIDIFDAIYDYARDNEGNPISDHYRERVIRNNGKFQWKASALGLIHETIVSDGFPKRVEVPKDTFRVMHVAEEGHYDQSSLRNHIALLYEYLKTKGKDPRTTYYLGTEFFNRKMYAHCIKIMQEYIKVGGWDEERYRAWVRMAEAYHQLKDVESSRNAYLNAVKELPNYPDAYMGLGESYYSGEYWSKAIEFLEIGMRKPIPKTKSAVDMVKYAFRPLPFMALATLKLGRLSEAYDWFLKAKKLNPKHPWVKDKEPLFIEFKDLDDYVKSFVKLGQLAQRHYPETLPRLADAVPDQIKDQELLLSFKRKYTEPKVWGDKSIVFFCSSAFEDWGPDSLKTGTGGSEEAVIHLSKRFVRMGWEVTVYNNCLKEETRDGVRWRRYEHFNPRDDFNILIAWRNNPYIEPKKARLKFVDVHDVPNNQFYTPESLNGVKVMVKSDYHRSLFPQLKDANFEILGNGIDLLQFDKKVTKVPNKMIWTSSLDRGLEYLLEIWSDIRKAVPDATLDVYYGWNLWDSAPNAQTAIGRAWKAKMLKLLDQEGVDFRGRVGTDEIAQAYLEADVFPYPTDFPEIDCISIKKAQAAKCIPVSSDYAAVKTSNKYGIQVKGNPQDKGFMTRYKKELISLLKSDKRKEEFQKMSGKEWSWDLIAQGWNKLFKEPEMEYPLVSVIIPTYNRQEFLDEAIQSVRNQTYPNKEIVVVDDGSSPQAEVPSGVRYIRLEHSGKPSVTKNAGIMNAIGKWHYFLDDDDKFVSRHSLMHLMRNVDKGSLIFSDTLLAFPSKEVVMTHDFSGLENLKKHFQLPGVYLLKANLSKKILFNEALDAAEDYERSIRLVEAGAKPYHVPQPHYWYRHHGGQIQYQKQKEQDKQVGKIHENIR